jgi:hypothetical protein
MPLLAYRGEPVVRHNSVRARTVRGGTIDGFSQGLDPPRLDAPPPFSPPADSSLGHARPTPSGDREPGPPPGRRHCGQGRREQAGAGSGTGEAAPVLGGIPLAFKRWTVYVHGRHRLRRPSSRLLLDARRQSQVPLSAKCLAPPGIVQRFREHFRAVDDEHDALGWTLAGEEHRYRRVVTSSTDSSFLTFHCQRQK